MSNRIRRTLRNAVDLDLAVQGSWSTPVELTLLGNSGLISRATFRGPPSSTVTSVDVRVYQGQYDDTTDPATVPDNDIVLDWQGIVVAGHASTNDEEKNVLKEREGAAYDLATLPPGGTLRGAGGARATLWVAVKSVVASAADEDAEVYFEAIDAV